MCLLIESIKLENNQLKNIEYHNNRFNRSRFDLFGINREEDLSELVKIENSYDSVQKVRITYGEKIEKIEVLPYKRAVIEKLLIVKDNDIDYTYKYADRSAFTKYITKEKTCILIIKSGFVTDTSFSNVALSDGNKWYTPHTYLLRGTMREMLIQSGQLKERKILMSDLKNYSRIRLINAFNGFDNPFELGIEDIITDY